MGLKAHALAVGLVYAVFLALAGDGLFSYFSADDMMNLYGYWSKPWQRLVLDFVNPFAGGFRPVGTLFYLPIFRLFGFDPMPFRIVCFVLMALNIAIAYAVVLRLTGTWRAALFAAFLFSYHAHFADLYYSSGTIYDLLAFPAFHGCLLWYAAIRDRGRDPSAFECVGLGAIFWFGLASKEVVAVLPAVLILYEAIYHRAGPLLRWSRWRSIGILSVLAAIYLAPRLIGSAATMASNPAYHPSIELMVALKNIRHYAGLLLYMPIVTTGRVAVALCILTLALAFKLRDRHMLFGWGLFAIGALPVLFILPRGPFVLYIGFVGMALYLSALFVRRWQAMVLVVPLLVAAHVWRKPYGNDWAFAEQSRIRRTAELARGAYPALPKGARVTLVDNPFPDDDYTPLFVLRLLYRDPAIEIRRVRRGTFSAPESGYLLDFPTVRPARPK